MASAQEAEQIIQSLNGHGRLLGKHIEHCAKRLLYELLRYANGKPFARASAANESPFITFKIYPNRIVTDCNHDDLIKADLEAICQPVNKEQMKGANFKTLVAATKNAHIQSGNFSFEFQHSKFDINSDTMRPVWVTPAEPIPGNLTRITLYLHDQGTKEDIAMLRKVIISQFEKLEEECLLFLKDLRVMRIEFFDKDGKIHRSKDLRKQTVDEYRVSLEVTTVDEGEEKTHTQLYHVMEQSANDLSTNIMLAFPLTDEFKVRADNKAKKLFNLVPLQTSPLGFHVHSAFEFEYGQDGIVIASAYISSIQDQVATAFIQAILQFCEHPTLRYHWPLFLTPRVRDSDPLWSALDAEIRSWMAQNPILMSRDMKHWRLISHLTILSADAQDEAGKPLLNDPISDPFLSSKYPPKVANMLKDYGLETLNSTHFLKLLELHFNDPKLRLRTMYRTKEWHGALYRLLSNILADGGHRERVKSLPFLHLRNGNFASAVSAPVYFPTTENIEIPEKLNMRVVRKSGRHELYPKGLYQQLGVLQATVVQVRSLILDSFSDSKDLSLQDIKSYLRYLYLTHQPFNAEHEQPYQAVKIMTLEMTIKRPSGSFVYLPGMDHPYTPQKLLGLGVFGLSHPLNFLHPEILKAAPNPPNFFHLSWNKWLCDCLRIRERLSLVQPKTLVEQESNVEISSTIDETDVLSEEAKYVFKHRPDRFLGFVQHLWAFEGPRVLRSPALVSEIQGLSAQNLCAVNRSLKLQDTWVPRKEFKDCVKHYMEYPNEFPFLKLEEEEQMDLAIATRWSFLKHFGVKSKNNMDFLLEILQSIKHSCSTISPWQATKVIELYNAIRARFKISIGDEKERALEFFNDSGILYIDGTGPAWTGISSCLWNAPADMVSSYSLRGFYEGRVYDKQQMDSLCDMFHVKMGIRDATVKDLVEELLLLRNEGCEDVARVRDIYNYLDKHMIASTEMRIAFDECGVILVKRGAVSVWLSASECFWSEAETTQLNSSLKGCYPNLKEFFLEKVGINVSAYDKLLDSTSTSLEETKSNMLSLMDETNGLMPVFPVEPIRKAKIFPVRIPYETGQSLRRTELCSVDTEFAIGDRETLKTLLGSNIKILDFDLIEVRRLQPVFRWLSIEDRYLSRCAKERLETVSPSEWRRWDLSTKAYHIARVGATFNSYGSCDDALSLYQRLRTVRIVEVTYIFMKLEVVQDGRTIRSDLTHRALAHISDSDDGLIIYVRRDDNDQQLCFFSVLPRKLQEWLMQDPDSSPNGASFEVTNALTSILASDVSVLDGILEDQGIVEVPFENQGAVQRRTRIKVRLPEVDQREPQSPRTLVMRGDFIALLRDMEISLSKYY